MITSCHSLPVMIDGPRTKLQRTVRLKRAWIYPTQFCHDKSSKLPILQGIDCFIRTIQHYHLCERYCFATSFMNLDDFLWRKRQFILDNRNQVLCRESINLARQSEAYIGSFARLAVSRISTSFVRSWTRASSFYINCFNSSLSSWLAPILSVDVINDYGCTVSIDLLKAIEE